MGLVSAHTPMANDKLRRQIVFEAARLLYQRQESAYDQARLKAARKISSRWIKPADMPTNREIRDELLRLTSIYGFGSPPPEGPDDREIDPADMSSSAIGPLPDDAAVEETIDRFALYRALLVPLSRVRQDPQRHPEGDVLYHSLQVFELGRDALPYDEEFLLAALLHDVGKGLDPRDHLEAGLRALGDHVSERTAWLIRHHADAHAVHDGTIGARARRRLSSSESFEELMLLGDCDRAGRQPGMQVPELDEALDYVRDLDRDS